LREDILSIKISKRAIYNN